MKGNNKKNVILQSKQQETLDSKIAKCVFESKKISERILGYVPFDLKFIILTYLGETLRPAKITSLERGIVGILDVDETSSMEKIGRILGLNVKNDKAEKQILEHALNTLKDFKAIEGDDSCLALTEAGRNYAAKGERPETYNKQFELYVTLDHPAWYDLKNAIGVNNEHVSKINTPSDKVELSLDQIQVYAEQQAEDVHFPQNRYLLQSAKWVEGHEASYTVYVCFVQSVANNEVRCFVYDENSQSLNGILAEYLNSDSDLLERLLQDCIKIESTNDESTKILSDSEVEDEKAKIAPEIKEAEQHLLEEEAEELESSTSENRETKNVSSKFQNKDRLHKKALYDSISFEIELQNMFKNDDPDEIWLISPWIRKSAFMQDRGPMIEKFLKNDSKKVFIAYSEPAANNDGRPMVDQEVEPGIKELEETYPNFFHVQLPEFHLKNVIEVKGDQKILFSGSFNVLSFSVSKKETHVRREEMALAHHTIASKKHVECQIEFARVYSKRILKEIESLNPSDAKGYKNERLDYFRKIDNPEIRKLFSPIENLLEEKSLDALKDGIKKVLTDVGQKLVVASNRGGLAVKERKLIQSQLEEVDKQMSSGSVDDPSLLELMNNDKELLDRVPDKSIFSSKKRTNNRATHNNDRISETKVVNSLDLDKKILSSFKSKFSDADAGYITLASLYFLTLDHNLDRLYVTENERDKALANALRNEVLIDHCKLYLQRSKIDEKKSSLYILMNGYYFSFPCVPIPLQVRYALNKKKEFINVKGDGVKIAKYDINEIIMEGKKNV